MQDFVNNSSTRREKKREYKHSSDAQTKKNLCINSIFYTIDRSSCCIGIYNHSFKIRINMLLSGVTACYFCNN